MPSRSSIRTIRSWWQLFLSSDRIGRVPKENAPTRRSEAGEKRSQESARAAHAVAESLGGEVRSGATDRRAGRFGVRVLRARSLPYRRHLFRWFHRVFPA